MNESEFFRHYYNDDPQQVQRRTDSALDVFKIQYTPTERSTDTLRQAMLREADRQVRIASTLGLKPCVLYSGGIDSELIVRCLLEIGQSPETDFEVWHIRYKDASNAMDTAWATRSMQDLGIHLHFFHLEVYDFYQSNRCMQMCLDNGIVYPTMTSVCRALQTAHDSFMYPITGHGVPDLKIGPQGEVVHYDLEYQRTWAKFCDRNSIPACHTFYRGSSELYRLYLTEAIPVMTRHPLDDGEREVKRQLFESFELRRRPKYTGHERYWRLDYPYVREAANKLAPVIGYDYRSGYARPALEVLEHWSYDTELHRVGP